MTTIHTTPDGLGGVFVYAGPVRVGRVFPTATTGLPDHQPRPGCRWYGKRPGSDARIFDTHNQAHAYVSAQETP